MSTPDSESDGASPDGERRPASHLPFTTAEVEAVTTPGEGEAELEDIEAAEIDERAPELEAFDRVAQRSRKLPPERIRTVVQSLLFVRDKPVTLEQLHEATGIDRPLLLRALQALGGTLREGVSGIVLAEVAGGWQLRTDPASAEYVRRFLRLKPQRLTRAAVETLAIIAYRQPVTRPEIEDIRGVDSGAVIKALLDRKLLKILGKKDEVGRPILYGTTREFLEFFALKDLAALPTLREFQELSQEHQEIVEQDAPPPSTPAIDGLLDPDFAQQLAASTPQAEAALAQLEAAMETAETRAKAAAEALDRSAAAPARAPEPDESP